MHLAGNLKNCDGSKRATDVGGQHIRKCHRKDESSLAKLEMFAIILEVVFGPTNDDFAIQCNLSRTVTFQSM